jgi:hypothetical protein
MEGQRASSRGHQILTTERPGYHKVIAEMEPRGPGEQALYEALLKKPKGILLKQAAIILAGEMSLPRFITRHAMALALWSDKRRVGSLKAKPKEATN